MAQLGPAAQRSADIAALLDVKLSSLAPVRAKLIKKGMIYSPLHGDMAFTVPLFDEFMCRAMPNFLKKGSTKRDITDRIYNHEHTQKPA